ncbi:MAG: DEAD/DEAH box helicase [Symbiobacteriia bacterium]
MSIMRSSKLSSTQDLVLHGTWLPDATCLDPSTGCFLLWAERATAAQPARRSGRLAAGPRRRPHPFAVPADQLLESLSLGLSKEEEILAAREAIVWLPPSGGRPVPSPEASTRSGRESVTRSGGETDQASVAAGEPGLWPWLLEGVTLAPGQALPWLLRLTDPALRAPERLGTDLVYWSKAAWLALQLTTAQHFVPGFLPGEDRGSRGRAVWRPIFDAAERQLRQQLTGAMPAVCQALLLRPPRARAGSVANQPPDFSVPHVRLDSFLAASVDALVRGAINPSVDPSSHAVTASAIWRRRRRLADAPAAPLHLRWAAALVSPDPVVRCSAAEAKALSSTLEAWASPGLQPGQADPVRVCFRLDAPEEQGEEEGKEAHWALRFFLQAAAEPSLLVPAAEVWRSRGKVLRYLNRRFEHVQEHLLQGLGQAVRLCPAVAESLREPNPTEARLTTAEAYRFLTGTAPLFEESGFGVLLPAWWTEGPERPRLGLKVRVRSAKGTGDAAPSRLSALDLVQFDWRVALGEDELSSQEFEQLVKLKVPLVRMHGQWVALKPEEMRAAARVWERHVSREASGAGRGESLQSLLPLMIGLGPESEGTGEGMPVTAVEASGWVSSVLAHLQGTAELEPVPLPQGFAGELRPYQERGLAWLAFLTRWGLGACLADDMGLGKTVQAIALLLWQKERAESGAAVDAGSPPAADGGAAQAAAADGASQPGPVLLICPTSVVGNWQREFARFAPALRVLVHHGGSRLRGADLAEEVLHYDVAVSSYALLHRDRDTLQSVAWSGVVLDEAQNIKNPGSQQSQAARQLRAQYRIALTGTPVENHPGDLWSLLDFLNPGLLGPAARFRQRFTVPIQVNADASAAERLRALIRPFLLRRVKTDRAIIADLPDKIEMKVFCSLTREQTTLYEAVARDMMQRIEEAEDPIQRRGLVLATLTRLKQVCNHPAQFLSDGSALGGRSGKLERLTEMLDEALAEGDVSLVFTQFAEMGELLSRHLEDRLGFAVPFLQGKTPRKVREEMVAQFQRPGGAPVFILSLKAGGTGLNLTRANRVFHFDRWWNPAVEEQATDRAHRIGQSRTVHVHKLVTAGTVEEHIEAIIEAKRGLADSLVGSGEAWLTELTTEELRRLVTLGEEAQE